MENHKGFIVLVDISGYTNFVSKHNIDSSKNKKLDFGQAHAEHIISDLLEKVINELDEVLTINKLLSSFITTFFMFFLRKNVSFFS